MNTNNNRYENIYNKLRENNLFRKCKFILIYNLRKFINNKIKEIYNNNIGNKITIKKLFQPKKKIIGYLNIDFNLMLLEKSLLEIFSDDISNSPNSNKRLIEELLNEKEEDNRNYFKNLFNLTFLDCLDHFTTKRVIEELQGLKTFLDIKNDENKSKSSILYNKDDLGFLEYYFNHYEEILNKRNSRRIKFIV